MQAEDLLQTYTRQIGDTVLLQLIGELDIATAPLAEGAADRALTSRPRYVRLDLTRLTFCDAVGLHTLQRITNTIRAAHAFLLLDGIHPNLERTLILLEARSPWEQPPAPN
ncbi:STAS domain-containing protein [Streptomyces sp. NPDC004787]|uniref:STAS domain-containing protein n=1 Tax=Streptomyces sp. NPDC004787 TaxID=3154291 RepID=UPI00339E122D